MEPEPFLSREEFVRRAEELIKDRFSDRRVSNIGEMVLTIDGIIIRLGDAYQRVKNDSGLGNEIIQECISSIEDILKDSLYSNRCSLDILPIIMPSSSLESITEKTVSRPFVNDCRISYVIDFPKSFRYISEKDISCWNIGNGELEEIAINNLERKFESINFKKLHFYTGEIAISIWGNDIYNPSAILLPDFYDRFASELGGNFYAGVHSRSETIILPENLDEESIGRLKRYVVKNYEGLPFTISPELFLVTRDGIAGRIEGGL